MGPLMHDLGALIHNSTLHYTNTCPQHDIKLSEDFQCQLEEYLNANGYSIVFNEYTSVIVTPFDKTMYAPNQWFVIAAYAFSVYSELMIYKRYLLQLCEILNINNYKDYISKLRDEANQIDFGEFKNGCQIIFSKYPSELITLATDQLWKFSTNYSWWSGNKTIDRGDFYLSVILNMLGLVNASQSFVGEIVAIYYNSNLKDMIGDLSTFTDNAAGPTYLIDDSEFSEDNMDMTADISMPHDITQDDDNDTEILISIKSKKR